jgi:hypothetical protein
VDVASLPGGAWNFGSSIMTFAFPGGLFIVVALALWVAYTKPEPLPGTWVGRPMSYTLTPSAQASAAPAAQAQTGASAEGGAIKTEDSGTAGSPDGGTAGGGAAGTGDGA